MSRLGHRALLACCLALMPVLAMAGERPKETTPDAATLEFLAGPEISDGTLAGDASDADLADLLLLAGEPASASTANRKTPDLPPLRARGVSDDDAHSAAKKH